MRSDMLNSTERPQILFSPPDISATEIQAMEEVLRSGWLTTGPKTKLFETELASYCGTERVAALNSATSALEMCLHLLGIGPGDEVITSAYTYTASASVIYHVGATPVLVDVAPNSYHIDPNALGAAVTKRTKAVIPVDYAGVTCDYQRIRSALGEVSSLYSPTAGTLQEAYGNPILIADGAHSFGAKQQEEMSGQIADFTVFSFHAVKNLVTGEGGALTWRSSANLDDDVLYRQLMLLSLHGQTKDALTKSKAGSWEYDIVNPYFKCNMADINAALGLAQLKRYQDLLNKRHAIANRYCQGFQEMFDGAVSIATSFDSKQMSPEKETEIQLLQHVSEMQSSSCHLFPVRLIGHTSTERNRFIELMANCGVPCNVHYKPLPLLSAYRKRGFDIRRFPYAYGQYCNEVSIPLHTLLSESDVDYILGSFKKCFRA